MADTTLPVALVFGAAVLPDGSPSAALRRRAERACGLYRSGEVGRIVCSGGVVRHPPAEAEVIAGICREHGIPDEAVVIEDRSTSTAENVRNVRGLLAGMKDPPVVLVSDAWHLPRVRLAAKRLGLTVVGSASTDGEEPARWSTTLRETLARAWYWLTLRP